jgi:hypothetical protein
MNRDAFDDGPNQARRLDFRFTPEDFIEGPNLAVIDVMQGRDDAGCARLLDLIERNQVLGSEPPPTFSHVRIVLHFYGRFPRPLLGSALPNLRKPLASVFVPVHVQECSRPKHLTFPQPACD